MEAGIDPTFAEGQNDGQAAKEHCPNDIDQFRVFEAEARRPGGPPSIPRLRKSVEVIEEGSKVDPVAGRTIQGWPGRQDSIGERGGNGFEYCEMVRLEWHKWGRRALKQVCDG
jgi:hypothetical protein